MPAPRAGHVTVELGGWRESASSVEFSSSKEINLCDEFDEALSCGEVAAPSQCLDTVPSGCDPTYDCPAQEPVFLCNGTGGSGMGKFNLLDGDVTDWLEKMQPLEFMRSEIGAEFQSGMPVVVKVQEVSLTDTGAGSAEAEYCAKVWLISEHCLGGTDEGRLCTDDSECNSASCGIAGIPTLGTLVTTGGVTVSSMGTCGDMCGDGARDPIEECDDWNTVPGDGCDASCNVEACWNCADVLGGLSTCTAVVPCGSTTIPPPTTTTTTTLPPPQALRCKAAKAKAAGKKAGALLKAFGKNVAKPDPPKLANRISKAQAKLTKSFAKAESKGGCLTPGDTAAIEAKVDAFVADVSGQAN